MLKTELTFFQKPPKKSTVVSTERRFFLARRFPVFQSDGCSDYFFFFITRFTCIAMQTQPPPHRILFFKVFFFLRLFPALNGSSRLNLCPGNVDALTSCSCTSASVSRHSQGRYSWHLRLNYSNVAAARCKNRKR